MSNSVLTGSKQLQPLVSMRLQKHDTSFVSTMPGSFVVTLKHIDTNVLNKLNNIFNSSTTASCSRWLLKTLRQKQKTLKIFQYFQILFCEMKIEKFSILLQQSFNVVCCRIAESVEELR